MSFLKRLYYFSTGLIIGILFLFFVLNGKKTSCNYGPSARVIDNIISKELIIKVDKDTIENEKLIDSEYDKFTITKEDNLRILKKNR